MPTYEFENTKTGEQFEDMMTISEKEEYLKKNPHINQIYTRLNIVSGVNTSSKTDSGWKENLSRIAEAHPNSALAKEHGSKTIKQVKTEQVLKKHRARKK